MFLRRHWWAVFYSVFLICFTVYLVMDTFVISRVYTVLPETEGRTDGASGHDTVLPETEGRTDGASGRDTVQKSGSGSDVESSSSETSYSDGAIEITVTEYREYDTSVYVADIVLSSPKYLQTAFAQNVYGRNVTEKTSQIAENVNAVLAINGDFYGTQEKGYVLRNGKIYRNTAESGQEDLVVYEDGSFGIISEDEITAEELLAKGAQQVLSFGPALVEEGAVAVSENDEVSRAKASNPRTAVGIIDDLHYVFVVSDGRTDESAGLSLFQLAEFMKGLDVKTAYNLDGGGSSTMYFNGEVINNPTSSGRSIKERSVSDIVYIGY